MVHKNIVEFEVYGEYGLFSDPITRVGGEKMTYMIPTYEALKGIVSSIYWKPTFIWYIDAVRIIHQIQTEMKAIRNIKYSNGKTDLSMYTYLKDCRYQVKAHFEWNMNRPELEKDRNENKHFDIAKRMIKKGGRRDIFLGTRECQGYVIPCNFGEGEGKYDNVNEMQFGLMYHGITYPDENENKKMIVNLWNPVMKKGIIEFCKPDECIHKDIKTFDKIKIFDKNNFSGLKEFEEDK